MATVMIGWELGGGLGHVMRAAALAHALVPQGVRVVVALADLADCARVSWPEAIGIVPAPQPRRLPQGFERASSFAELMYGSGYHDVHQVTGLVTGWCNLIELAGADILVADHAPSAHLAARISDVPLARIGSGFFAPPPSPITPSYRTWEPVDGARAQATERRVLEVLNMNSAAAGLMPAASVQQALLPDLELISSWPELDCYANERARGSVSYLGNEYVGGAGSSPKWSQVARGERPRAIAYLKSGYAAFGKVLDALSREFETVAFVSGLDANASDRLQTEHMRLTAEPIALAEAARQADFLVCHAGAGTAPWFLAAGKPALLLPYTAEQHVNAMMMEATGAARLLLPHTLEERIAHYLKDLSSAGSYRNAAAKLAARWDGQPDAMSVAAEKILMLLDHAR